MRAVTQVNTEQAPKLSMREPTCHNNEEGRRGWVSERGTRPTISPG